VSFGLEMHMDHGLGLEYDVGLEGLHHMTLQNQIFSKGATINKSHHFRGETTLSRK